MARLRMSFARLALICWSNESERYDTLSFRGDDPATRTAPWCILPDDTRSKSTSRLPKISLSADMAFGLQQSIVSLVTTSSVSLHNHHLHPASRALTSLVQSGPSSFASTCLGASPSNLIDCSQAAINFFTSIRVPASLIGGNALSAFFELKDRTANPRKETSRITLVVLFAYQSLSLACLLMSFNTIVTATNASNSLMVANDNRMAKSAYDFLMREMPYEYVSVKCGFYGSIFSCLGAVACRALLDFKLLRKDRWRSVLMVLFSMGGLSSNMLHMVNASIAHTEYSNFWTLSLKLFQLFCDRPKGPVFITSVISYVGALITFLTLVPRMYHYTDKRDKEKSVAPVIPLNMLDTVDK
jgi:hypothetical protein